MIAFFVGSLTFSKISLRRCAAAVAVAAVAVGSSSTANAFDGPHFRKGEWHFVRTLDLALTQNVKKRVWEKVMTRCVDPTDSMKATFSSKSVGSCVSTQPQKSGNTYTFARRCDYMGPVSTVITVHTQDSYTEINELTVGKYPRTDLVVARRVGDCHG